MELSPGLLETYMDRFELTKDSILEQKKVFDLLDDDFDGKITLVELEHYNSKFQGGFTDAELKQQFAELHTDGTDRPIHFLDFLKVYVKGEFDREVHLGLEHSEVDVKDLAPESTPRRRTARSPTSLETLPEASEPDPIIGAQEVEEAHSSTEMKISRKHNTSFYLRAATLFLRGAEDKAPVRELKVSALGEAINTAVSVALRLEADHLGAISKVTTSYPDMPSGRGCAQILITIVAVEA